MAIVRKVKASEKARRAFKKHMTVIITVIAVISICAGAGLLAMFGSSLFSNHDTIDMDKVRSLLKSNTEYEGQWSSFPEQGFQIYMPDLPKSDMELNSLNVVCNYNTEYDNNVLEAFGVIDTGDIFDSDEALFSDMENIASGVLDLVTEDIGKVTHGYSPIGTFEISKTELDSGLDAIQVTGSVEVYLAYQPSDGSDPYAESYTFNLNCYITLLDNKMVGVWEIWDPFDYFINEDAEAKLFTCASTLIPYDLNSVEVPTESGVSTEGGA